MTSLEELQKQLDELKGVNKPKAKPKREMTQGRLLSASKARLDKKFKSSKHTKEDLDEYHKLRTLSQQLWDERLEAAKKDLKVRTKAARKEAKAAPPEPDSDESESEEETEQA